MAKENERDIEGMLDEMLSGEGDGPDTSRADRVRRKPRIVPETQIDIDDPAAAPEAAQEDDDADTPPVVEQDDGIAAEMEALRAERDELRDRFMRALADAENARKRADRERREAENYGGAKLSRDMLPVYDNLKRAVDAIPEDAREQNAALIEGVELTLREMVNVFSRHGITPIAPEVGDRFDPKLHEAMFEAPVPNTQSGDIIQVMNVGFMLHDRLLRAAQVGVSSTPRG